MLIPDHNPAPINFAFMNAGEKLRQAIEEAGFSKNEFGRRMGLPNDEKLGSNVQNWMTRGIPGKLSFRAGRILGRNPEWLCHDDDELPEGFSADHVDRVDQAADRYDLLSQPQKALITDLILELAGRPAP